MSHSRKPLPVLPDPLAAGLTETLQGVNEAGEVTDVSVVLEKPLTLYLNGREIVTMMTVGDWREELAVGYLLNQNMLTSADEITGIDVDEELDVVVVRTEHETDVEEKLKKKTLTSGCAQGTAFGDLMEQFDAAELNADARLKVSDMRTLLKTVNTLPSLYLEAGAIHGCVLSPLSDGAIVRSGEPLIYTEDVGRHNAVDKIAGFMALEGLSGADHLLYTTGRLTSEMVIKTVRMGIPVLVSRSGFTAWGVELARQVGLTLIGRARGNRYTLLSGSERLVRDV